MISNSRVVDNFNIHSSLSRPPVESHSSIEGDNENSSDEEPKLVKVVNEKSLKKSLSDAEINKSHVNGIESQLSKSLGATDINCTSEDDEPFSDAQTEVQAEAKSEGLPAKSIFVSAAMSIDYRLCPPTTKFIRGENIVSCWAMRPVDEDSCTFEWILCIDLKGSLPKYVLNTVSSLTFLQNFLYMHPWH